MRDDAAAWGATQLSRWCAVLKAIVQVNVMSWQYVASEVLYFTRVCPSPSDVTSALVITAVTSVSLCCVPNRLLVKPWHLKKRLSQCVYFHMLLPIHYNALLSSSGELCILTNKTFTLFLLGWRAWRLN